jgi:signal transduction histidine kinase
VGVTSTDTKPVSWRPALLAGMSAFALVAVGGLAAHALDLRSDVKSAGERAGAAADAAITTSGAGPRRLALDLASQGLSVRIQAALPSTTVLATGGPEPVWTAGSPSWYGSAATAGTSGWRLLDDAVQVERPLPNGRRVFARAALPQGTTSPASSSLIAVGGLALISGLLAGVIVYRRRRRSARALARLASATRTIATGNGAVGELPQGELAATSAAILAARDRMAEMQAVADSQFDGVESVIRPLATPLMARTPAGREVRSTALDTLVGSLVAEDRYMLDSAVDELLAARGRPAGRRVELGAGRMLDVESWAIPGGRVVAVVERGEQERLRRLRRQLTGAAARHLRAPLAEIEARATELFTHVPASAAPPVQKILAAADRMDRLVTSMLRGTAHDPQARPPRLGPLSVSGLLWALAQKWDRSLRHQALRMDVDLAPDLPPALADAALVEEILTELIDNAAKYTPRGGTIELRGRSADDGTIEIEVRDTGEGIPTDEVGTVTQPFFRGVRSEVLPGAGLGLGVASALAERLGGRLVVHPGPGGRVALVLKEAPVTEERKLSASVA